jgi:hypothetical protein
MGIIPPKSGNFVSDSVLLLSVILGLLQVVVIILSL